MTELPVPRNAREWVDQMRVALAAEPFRLTASFKQLVDVVDELLTRIEELERRSK